MCEVGDGTKVSFWLDLRQGKNTFKERYLDLFLLTRDTEAMVADYVEIRHDQCYWNPVFIRAE